MRRWIALGVMFGGLALAGSYLIWPARDTSRRSDDDVSVAIKAPAASASANAKNSKGHSDGHGSGSGGADKAGCQTGCSLKKHYVAPFTLADYKKAIASFKTEPMAANSKGLETLLFYGDRTRALIKKHGTYDLPRARRDYLMRELSRTHATVRLRIVDEHGVVRASTGPMHVPIGRKQHLRSVKLNKVQSLEFNGTVMRVGLYHLWSRY